MSRADLPSRRRDRSGARLHSLGHRVAGGVAGRGARQRQAQRGVRDDAGSPSRSRHAPGADVSVVLKKGPRGESANAAIPCDPEIFERVVAEADVVITGTADCGSCTAYSVHDGVELEKAGRPAIVVTTTEFRPIAETMAEHFGLPELRIVVLPHPIGGTDPDTLSSWADAAVDTVLALCTRRGAAYVAGEPGSSSRSTVGSRSSPAPAPASAANCDVAGSPARRRGRRQRHRSGAGQGDGG